MKLKSVIRYTLIVCVLCSSFFLGQGVAKCVEHFQTPALPVSTEGNWGLSFPVEGGEPEANATSEELGVYNACYKGDSDEKKLYLTFDVGYDNGNTAKILDVLKERKIPAAFFVVGTLIDYNPELVKRMSDEGHVVGNHTHHHKNMSQLSTMDQFKPELEYVEKRYADITGKELDKFYRPPQGIYNVKNLKMAQSLGYKTVFWSLAYVDWKQDAQPTKEEAFQTLLPRTHPGAIVLLHSTSSTNSAILSELLDKWETLGYTFHSLKDL